MIMIISMMKNITNRAARIIGPLPAITPTNTTIPGTNVAAGVTGDMIGQVASTIAAGIGAREGGAGGSDTLTLQKCQRGAGVGSGRDAAIKTTKGPCLPVAGGGDSGVDRVGSREGP